MLHASLPLALLPPRRRLLLFLLPVPFSSFSPSSSHVVAAVFASTPLHCAPLSLSPSVCFRASHETPTEFFLTIFHFVTRQLRKPWQLKKETILLAWRRSPLLCCCVVNAGEKLREWWTRGRATFHSGLFPPAGCVTLSGAKLTLSDCY